MSFRITALPQELPESEWETNYTLRPRQNGRHFPDDIFKLIFLNKNVGISINISLKFLPKGPINKILELVEIMAWRRPGKKPLSEPMVVSVLMHICVTQHQRVNWWSHNHKGLHIKVNTHNATALVPFKQPWEMWVNASHESTKNPKCNHNKTKCSTTVYISMP